MENSKIELGQYQHYKGHLYEVIGLARHTETLEELVVYKSLYDSANFPTNSLWVRPLSMFIEPITLDGSTVPRFRKT